MQEFVMWFVTTFINCSRLLKVLAVQIRIEKICLTYCIVFCSFAILPVYLQMLLHSRRQLSEVFDIFGVILNNWEYHSCLLLMPSTNI